MVGLVDEWMGSEVFGRLQPLSQVGLGTGEQEKKRRQPGVGMLSRCHGGAIRRSHCRLLSWGDAWVKARAVSSFPLSRLSILTGTLTRYLPDDQTTTDAGGEARQAPVTQTCNSLSLPPLDAQTRRATSSISRRRKRILADRRDIRRTEGQIIALGDSSARGRERSWRGGRIGSGRERCAY